MKLFITGATGFVGRNLLAFLNREVPDLATTCLVRDPEKAKTQWAQQIKNEKIHWLPGDLLKPETYQKALLEADAVIHAAALVSLKNGPEFYTMNTDATRHLVSALKGSTHLKRLVFVGSISAVDRPWEERALEPLNEDSPSHPNTDYGKSKLLAEELIIRSGLPYTILRPPYIYGPYPRIQSSMDRLIRDVHAQKHYTQFPFPGYASEIYVEDLADMIWQAVTHPATEKQSFFVCNPQPVQVRNVFSKLAHAMEIPYQPMSVSETAMQRFQRAFYHRQPESLILRILFENYFYCSPEKWFQATGYQPRYGFEEGMAKTLHWYRSQGLL